MRFPRSNLASALIISTVACVCLWGTPHPRVRAQEARQQLAVAVKSPDDTARGVELYRQGKHREAIEILRGAVKVRKEDAQAWLHLGIALNRAGEAKEARKAFEKASKLRPEMIEAHIGLAYIFTAAGKLQDAEREAARALVLNPRNAEAHYALGFLRLRQDAHTKALAEANAALEINPNFGGALILKAQALIASYAAAYGEKLEQQRKQGQPPGNLSSDERARLADLLKEAAENVEQYLKLFPASPDAAGLREQAETLRWHSNSVNQSAGQFAYKGDEVTTKAQVLSKPAPQYTDRARQRGVEGMIRLRMVLSSDGQVRHILVLRGLTDGLMETAIAAARRIKFTPATKDGKPVSQFVTIEYNFHIY